VKFTTRKFNSFLLFKLPSAFFTGVRLVDLTENSAVIRVKHRWINQNPFNSLYYGVQAMAAELSTGVLVIKKISDTGKPISMLVTKQSATFTKKARGVIRFTCSDGDMIDKKIESTLKTGEGQTFVLKSIGLDEQGEAVSSFEFEWSVKVKSVPKFRD